MSVLLEVFCCYAREDQEMLTHLKKHLAPLVRQGLIMIWSDANLDAGVEWEKELHEHLDSANIILLFISPDFMASDYCYSTEMMRAIERHNQGSACVIPILLRSTFWQNAPFAKLQMVPTNANPVTNWPDRDQAFHNITEHINQVITGHQIQQNRSSLLPTSLQQTSQMMGTSLGNISGEWEAKDDFEMYEYMPGPRALEMLLSQMGATITGTGSVFNDGVTGELVVINGSIDDTTVNLKVTPLNKKGAHYFIITQYYEMNLIFVPPGKMSGHETKYYKDEGAFKRIERASTKLILLRKDIK